MDLFARGQIDSNLIEITPDLGELFTSYWTIIMQPDQRTTIALPFFHLWKEKERFWHLVPRPGKEVLLAEAYQVPSTAHRIRFSVHKLTDTILGAELDEALFLLMCSEDTRNSLRQVLMTTYFIPDLQTILAEQGLVNLSAFRYSQALLREARTTYAKRKEPNETEEYPALVRDQGFRRAVVTAYDHTCALCGIRILTLEGHTVVAAAHIIPWSVSHDDNPRNGMAMCRVCHWCFDEGLVSVSSHYVLALSTQLTNERNIASYLLTLSNRSITGPAEEQLWPDPDALTWHHQYVFRKT